MKRYSRRSGQGRSERQVLTSTDGGAGHQCPANDQEVRQRRRDAADETPARAVVVDPGTPWPSRGGGACSDERLSSTR